MIGDLTDPAEQLREIARQFPSHLKELAGRYGKLAPRDDTVGALTEQSIGSLVG